MYVQQQKDQVRAKAKKARPQGDRNSTTMTYEQYLIYER